MSDVNDYMNFKLNAKSIDDVKGGDGIEEHVVSFLKVGCDDDEVSEMVVDAVTPSDAKYKAEKVLGEEAVIVDAYPANDRMFVEEEHVQEAEVQEEPAEMELGGEVKSIFDGLLHDIEKTKNNIVDGAKSEALKITGEKNAHVRELKFGSSWQETAKKIVGSIKTEIESLADAMHRNLPKEARGYYEEAKSQIKDLRKLKFGAGIYATHFENQLEKIKKKAAKMFESGGEVEKVEIVAKQYHLGDKYSSDFDYEGLFALAMKASVEWGAQKLRRLYDSFESVNLHTCAAPLWQAIQNLIAKNEEQAKNDMELFHKDIVSEIESYGDDEGFEEGGMLGYYAEKKKYGRELMDIFANDFPEFKKKFKLKEFCVDPSGVENLLVKVSFDDGESGIIDFYENKVIHASSEEVGEQLNDMRGSVERRWNNQHRDGGEIKENESDKDGGEVEGKKKGVFSRFFKKKDKPLIDKRKVGPRLYAVRGKRYDEFFGVHEYNKGEGFVIWHEFDGISRYRDFVPKIFPTYDEAVIWADEQTYNGTDKKRPADAPIRRGNHAGEKIFGRIVYNNKEDMEFEDGGDITDYIPVATEVAASALSA